MTMIESVAVRQRGGIDFETHYDNLCALQSSCPLAAVKSHLPEGVLDLNGDRIRAVDWIPILNTVRINKTIAYIAIRSYFQQTIEDQEKAGYPVRKKTPAVRCKEITYRLCRTIKECLSVNPVLACLELQGLPMRERDLSALSKGIAKSSTLQHISLEYSRIGDEGLEVLCRGIRNSPSVTSVNVTGCSLSWKGGELLAKIIKHQATRRHNEAWQDSLRYRRPDLDRMPGVRRITVNCNPMLGDQGAAVLAEALKDDLWLKALDLQQCGLGEVGAKALLDVLKYNTTIVVLDVRQNPMIDQEMLHSIMEQVMINCNGQDTEYKWVKAEPLQDPLKPKVTKKRTKTLQSSFGKKTTIKVNNRRRSRSAGATVARPLQPFNAENVKPGPGLPWRTALRANRYRGYPPDHSPSKAGPYDSQTDETFSPISSPGGAQVKIDYSTADDTTDTFHVRKGNLQLDSDDDLTVDKELKVELEQMRRRYREEKSARAVAEEKVLELSMENKRLHHEISETRTRHSILDDDRVLESIEASFKQFHAFLDLVRDAGLGQLITLAGINQSQMTIPLTSPQRQSLGGKLSFATDSFRFGAGDTTINNMHGLRNGDISIPPPDESFNLQQSRLDYTAVADSTADTTGLTAGDVSLPQPATGIIYPHITPDNYQANSDPTMIGFTPITSIKKPMSKFDQLYQKVLRETEGALSKTQDDSADSSAMGRSGLNYSSYVDSSGDPGLLEASKLSRGAETGAQSETSHHSQGSHKSGESQRSQGSRESQRSRGSRDGGSTTQASKDTVLEQKRTGIDPEELGLDPADMIVEHHDSDKSDFSDIEEIHEDFEESLDK